MLITFNNGRFVARNSYEHRSALKASGWQYDRNTSTWYHAGGENIDDHRAVRKFSNFMDAPAKARLDAVESGIEKSISASRAVDAEIDIPAPAGMAYLPFQRAGIDYALKHPDVILGDEMGLGKTIQAIGVANADQEINSVLVVCPASLKLNWQREFERWGTRNWSIAIAGAKKQDHLLDLAQVVIINYDILARYCDRLAAREWGMIVFDEAHYLKNKRAKRTGLAFGCNERQAKARLIKKYVMPEDASWMNWGDKLAFIENKLQLDPGLAQEYRSLIQPGLCGRRRIFMTGTPIPNRPIELFPIIQQIDPEGMGRSYTEYGIRYCDGEMKCGHWDMKGASNLDELQERLRATCLVRRLKKDVLADLPAKFRQVVEIEATGSLGRLARQEIEADRRHRKAIEAIARDLKAMREDHASEQYRDVVTRLRKADGARFTELSRIRHELAVAKIPSVIEHIHAVFDDGAQKLVIMAHHHDIIAALKDEFPEAAVICGEVASERRQEEVDRFQIDPECRLFIGSITAAGVGITLTAASTIVFAEQDWTPGSMKQAEDRCHRIGQKDSVLVQILVVDGSLDATMSKTLSQKEEVIDHALDAAREQSPQIETVAERRRGSTTDFYDEDGKADQYSFAAGQVEAIHRCLKLLAAADDAHASVINGLGFNKFDGDRGHRFASRAELTLDEASNGLRIVRKYKRQLQEDLYLAAIGGEIELLAPSPSIEIPADMPVNSEATKAEEALPAEAAFAQREKRKRGRPRRDEAQPPPTATERVKKSIDALVASGGKRLMLRLTPEAYEALKIIMDKEGIGAETTAINQTLVDRCRQLLCMPTE